RWGGVRACVRRPVRAGRLRAWREGCAREGCASVLVARPCSASSHTGRRAHTRTTLGTGPTPRTMLGAETGAYRATGGLLDVGMGDRVGGAAFARASGGPFVREIGRACGREILASTALRLGSSGHARQARRQAGERRPGRRIGPGPPPRRGPGDRAG